MPKNFQKQAEAKRDGVINPQNYNFNQNTANFDAIKRLRFNRNQPKNLARYMCHRGLWSTSSDTQSSLKQGAKYKSTVSSLL